MSNSEIKTRGRTNIWRGLACVLFGVTVAIPAWLMDDYPLTLSVLAPAAMAFGFFVLAKGTEQYTNPEGNPREGE